MKDGVTEGNVGQCWSDSVDLVVVVAGVTSVDRKDFYRRYYRERWFRRTFHWNCEEGGSPP